MASKKIPLSRARTFLRAMLSSASASTPSFSLLTRKHHHVHSTLLRPRQFAQPRYLSSSELPKKVNTKVNFSPSDSDSDENDSDQRNDEKKTTRANHYKPYEPFSKKPAIEDPQDPKDLQEIFHKMRSEGLFDNAVKMFDGLSRDGLTHEALELFRQIKDEGTMPDVVAHTAVIETYANAAQPKEALKVFKRMLAAGVAPNAYTYGVLVKGLASDDRFVGDAAKYVAQMAEKGMRPNAGVCVAAVEGLARAGKEEEAREMVTRVRAKGFGPEERDVREVLKGKRGALVRNVMNILCGM